MSDDLFADLDVSSTEFYPWQKTQLLGEHEVGFVVEPEDQPPSSDDLAAVACFWTELSSFDALARTFLTENSLDSDSATQGYLEHHLEGLRFEVLEQLFGDTEEVDIHAFVEALLLVRVALLPRAQASVFYYSLGQEITDYVLAVSIPCDGDAWSVDVASYDPSIG